MKNALIILISEKEHKQFETELIAFVSSKTEQGVDEIYFVDSLPTLASGL